MDLELLLRAIVKARDDFEEIEALMQENERPSVEAAGIAFVCAQGGANDLAQLERDIRSELMAR